jgi:hypothetical protein
MSILLWLFSNYYFILFFQIHLPTPTTWPRQSSRSFWASDQDLVPEPAHEAEKDSGGHEIVQQKSGGRTEKSSSSQSPDRSASGSLDWIHAEHFSEQFLDWKMNISNIFNFKTVILSEKLHSRNNLVVK